MLFYEFDGIDGFSIWVTVWVLWWVQSRLEKAFRSISTIWSQTLKLNRSSIIVFLELEKVYLGMENVIRLCNHSRGWYFWNWPPHAKIALGLTQQNWLFLVSANKTTFWPRVRWEGESIAIIRCYDSIGIDIFYICVTICVLWRVETHLQKTFRDIETYCKFRMQQSIFKNTNHRKDQMTLSHFPCLNTLAQAHGTLLCYSSSIWGPGTRWCQCPLMPFASDFQLALIPKR